MRIYVLITILILKTSLTLADNIEKGFERLKVFDYFSAKGYFEKALKSKPAGAAYGLSLIYSTNNNPFYNLDSARVYILFADSAFTVSSKKQKESYKEIGVTESSVSDQKGTVCAKAFSNASKIFTVKEFNAYVKNYKFCSQVNDAIELRNSAAFRDAKILNSSNAFEEFMLIYPLSIEFKEAKMLYDQRLFEEITHDKSIESYKKYLLRFPDGPFKQEADRMIYQLSTTHHTINEYDLFVKTYQESYYLNEAWRSLYKLFFKDFNEDNYQAFIKAYPAYPFMEELNDDYKLLNSQLLPFLKNELWGYINEDGKEIIKPAYEENALFHEGLAIVKQNGKYGFINKSGKMIINCLYDEAESFKNKSAVVALSGKYGLINQSGENMIPFQYEDLSDPTEEICIALIDEQSGYISKSGKKITEFIYDFAGEFKDGYAVVGKDEKYGLIRKNGIEILKMEYDQIISVRNGIYRARRDNKWGIISGMGEIITPFIYSMISDFSEGKALIVKGGKCGFINETGKIIIPVNFVYSENLLNTALFKNNYVLLKQKTRSVLLDSAGNKILNNNFEDIGMISQGLIPLKKSKKWGYGTINGKLKIPLKYQEASNFEYGFAKVVMKNQAGIIDTSGKVILSAFYEDIIIKPACFLTRDHGLYGLHALNGVSLLPEEYDKINFISEKIAEAFKGEKKTYINYISGRIILKDN